MAASSCDSIAEMRRLACPRSKPEPKTFLPMNPAFLDLLRELAAAEARFLIVGAYAVSVHAEPLRHR